MSKYSQNMPPVLKDAIGWMFDYIDDDKIFLDFGCATGYFGQLIKKAKHNKVYGVEISDDKIEAAKVLDKVYSFDIDGEWPKEIYERKYDYVFFGDVIEHLKDPQRTLENCRKLLNKGGLIFVSTPNIAHLSIRLELMGGNFDYEPMGILDNTHLKYFTRKSLIRLVEAAGYYPKVIDFTVNDYPDTVVAQLLAKLGLKPNATFWKLIDKPEARAFQHKFILALPPVGKLPKPIIAKQLDDRKPEVVRNAALVDLKGKVTDLDHHAKQQAEIIEHYIEENKRLKSRLAHPVRSYLKTKFKG